MSVDLGGGSTAGRRTADGRGEAEHTAGVPLSADTETLGYLYETYVAYLYDYCDGLLRSTAAAAEAVPDTLAAAAAQIGELPDTGRLREWIYSIARQQCLNRRSQSAAALAPGWGAPDQASAMRAAAAGADAAAAGPAAPGGTGTADADTADIEIQDVDTAALEWETLQIARDALDGLADRDREVLNLAFRHGFEGAELAAVLGVSARRARALQSGATSRFEKSAGALAVLRAGYGWAPCATLETIAGDWDPGVPLTPALSRRLTRHIGSCDQCGASRGDRVFGPELLAGVPLAVPPAEVRQQIMTRLFETDLGVYPAGAGGRLRLGADGFPVQPRAGGPGRQRQLLAMAAALVLVVLIVGGGLLYKHATAPGTDPGRPAADVATGTRSSPSPSASQPSPAPSRSARKAKAKRHIARAQPRVRGLSPAPVGVLPVPQPPPVQGSTAPSPAPTGHSSSPSPPPTHSPGSPSPFPSSSPTIPSGSPSPSPSASPPSTTP